MSDYAISAGKRLAIEESEWLSDWYVSASPRNGNANAEGMWCQWVHLARLILADERTKAQMPTHFLPYEGPHLYSEHHPDCIQPDEPEEDKQPWTVVPFLP